MRIVFIIAQLTEGGAEREAVAFVNELVRMGQEVHLICLHDKPDDYVVDERVHRHLAPGTGVQIPKLKGAVNIVLMTALLRRIRGDVAVLFYVPFHLAVRLINVQTASGYKRRLKGSFSRTGCRESCLKYITSWTVVFYRSAGRLGNGLCVLSVWADYIPRKIRSC